MNTLFLLVALSAPVPTPKEGPCIVSPGRYLLVGAGCTYRTVLYTDGGFDMELLRPYYSGNLHYQGRWLSKRGIIIFHYTAGIPVEEFKLTPGWCGRMRTAATHHGREYNLVRDKSKGN